MTPRLQAIVLGGGLLALLHTGQAKAADDSVAVRCPRYLATLERARELLLKDDRPAALRELRRAQEVLSDCIQDETRGSSAGSVTG